MRIKEQIATLNCVIMWIAIFGFIIAILRLLAPYLWLPKQPTPPSTNYLQDRMSERCSNNAYRALHLKRAEWRNRPLVILEGAIQVMPVGDDAYLTDFEVFHWDKLIAHCELIGEDLPKPLPKGRDGF